MQKKASWFEVNSCGVLILFLLSGHLNNLFLRLEKLSCMFQLKSAAEDPEIETSSAICLQTGCGDHHVLYVNLIFSIRNSIVFQFLSRIF